VRSFDLEKSKSKDRSLRQLLQVHSLQLQSYDDKNSHPSPPLAKTLTYLLTLSPLHSYKCTRCTTTYNNCSTHNKSKKKTVK
jgi:hypothetical protein